MADLKFQHKVYMMIVLFVNVSFVVNGALFPLAAMNIVIVGLPHFRDLFYMLLRIVFHRCKCVPWSAEEPINDKRGKWRAVANVVAVIPAYKEDPEEVELTLTSISSQIKDDLKVAQIIVSDGFLDYHEMYVFVIALSFCYSSKTTESTISTKS